MKFPNTIALLNKIGEESAELYRSYLDSLDPYSSNASYTLYKSIDHKLVINENSLTLYFVASDHYIRIEYGRKGYQKGNGQADMSKAPPISAIRSWMIDKNIPLTGGADYKIQRSITLYGIQPKNYLAKVIDNAGTYRLSITAAVAKDVKNHIDETLKAKLKSTFTKSNNK